MAGLVPAIYVFPLPTLPRMRGRVGRGERRGCPRRWGPRRVTRRGSPRGHDAGDLVQVYRNDASSIVLVVFAANQDFALAGMIRLADHAFLFHPFNERGGAIIADLQPALDIAR
jgi:hypothetical protein